MTTPLRTDSVAIVGFATTSNSQAPWNNAQEYELWVCNRGVVQPWCTRWDRHFDPHTLLWTKEHFPPELYKEYVDFLSLPHGERIIYLNEPHDEFPNATLYPVDEVLANLTRPYLTNAISYQIALAIFLGAKRIGVWGVDLRADTEYIYERTNVEWLLGLAQGRGIEIVLPEVCGLINNDHSLPIYGIEDTDGVLGDVERMLAGRIGEINALMPGLMKKNDEIIREMHLGEGARMQSELYLSYVREARRGGTLRGGQVASPPVEG